MVGDGERPPGLRATLTLRSGAEATLRCLRADDADLLGAYFARLSPRTRDFYGPHRFDSETADRLCRETRTDTEVVRFVVTVPDGDGGRIIAYFIVGFRMQDSDTKRYVDRGTPLDDRTDAYLAPSVEDGYQDTGVGSAVMGHLVPWLRRARPAAAHPARRRAAAERAGDRLLPEVGDSDRRRRSTPGRPTTT